MGVREDLVAIDACLDALARRRARLEEEMRHPCSGGRDEELEEEVSLLGTAILGLSRVRREGFAAGVEQ